MKLLQNIELAYCTNVHRGSTWEETFHTLETYVLKVKKLVCPHERFAIGLRLSANAAKSLANPKTLLTFQHWLNDHDCYVFTINGFPYGNFHGERVKEQVYRPDWSEMDRLNYTVLLFEILENLLQPGEEGSVSTLPASFKEFHPANEIPKTAFENLSHCAQKIEHIKQAKDLDLHLGLEPEPLGSFETTQETISFFEQLQNYSKNENLCNVIGVNYDCCHLAVEYENASCGLNSLKQAGIRLSKLHLSSALKAEPTLNNRKTLQSFVEEVYLHQVVVGKEGKILRRYKDLDIALRDEVGPMEEQGDEWRIHFHVPLHSSPKEPLGDTKNHVLDTMDWLARNPTACRHLEMETYTWEVLPSELQSLEVVEQVAKEYEWTLNALHECGLGKE
ncbi:MAG: metabolite traffic protein EboE [Opitutae bacterium]|jgi:hypothetical protein|nr:metabolite traffic protein EboE [Opitutae bacterium]MBT5715621.1 metabolite traffic protein EboE [Opitutae bacterium]